MKNKNELQEQKKYKDTVFRLLFSEKKRALDLFYIADILQKMFMDKTLYSSKRITIPNPNFIVFYNGMREMPEKVEMKLSDSFALPADNPSLELKVTVLNINPGMNEKLKEKCQDLKQYMIYIEMVRKYAKNMSLKEAVTKAVNECIQGNILRDFLMEQKSEVIKMSIYEFDEEREMKLIREDEREIGREEGRTEGEHRMLMLNKHLLADDRMEDLKRALEEEEYRRALYQEYSL